MRHLRTSRQSSNGSSAMKRLRNAESINAPGRSFAGENVCATSAEPFEVNVIFTTREATAAALKASERLASGLADCIRLRAGIVVPLQLPLDQPLVSVEFFTKVLQEVAGQPGPDGLERSIHLYVCRDWVDTLLEVLKPNSVAVMGLRKRWYPTVESRLARVLRKKGIRLLLVDPRRVDPRQATPLRDVNVAAPRQPIGLRWRSALGAMTRRIHSARPGIESAKTPEVH
jgi:hypothetical protein